MKKKLLSLSILMFFAMLKSSMAQTASSAPPPPPPPPVSATSSQQDYIQNIVKYKSNTYEMAAPAPMYEKKSLEVVEYDGSKKSMINQTFDKSAMCSKLNKIFTIYHFCNELDGSSLKECADLDKKEWQDQFNSICDGKGKTSCECAAALAKENACDLPDHCPVSCELSGDDLKKISAAMDARVSGTGDDKVMQDALALCGNSQEMALPEDPKLSEEEIIKKYGSVENYKEMMLKTRAEQEVSGQVYEEEKASPEMYQHLKNNTMWYGKINKSFCSCMARKHCAVDYYCQASCGLDEYRLRIVSQYKTLCESDPKNSKCSENMKLMYRKTCGFKSSLRCMIDNACYTPPEQKECVATSTQNPGENKDNTVKVDGIDSAVTRVPSPAAQAEYLSSDGKCSMLPENALIGFGNILGFLSAFVASFLMMGTARYRKR